MPKAPDGGPEIEPDITINGHALTFAQAMTVRVALNNFAMLCKYKKSTLGPISETYGARLTEMFEMMTPPPDAVPLNPTSVTRPWDHIEEYLDANLPNVDFSHMGLTVEQLSLLRNGSLAITPALAERLEKVTQRPAKFWLRLEALYRTGLAEGKPEHA